MLNSQAQGTAASSVDAYCEVLLADDEEHARLSLRWDRLEQVMIKHHRWLDLSDEEQRALPAAREMHEIDARLTALSCERQEILPRLPEMAAADRTTLMLKLKVVRMLLLPDEQPDARALLDSTLRDLVVLWR